jgi:uncharacterized membrane protein HdeD (DUF308 family)
MTTAGGGSQRPDVRDAVLLVGRSWGLHIVFGAVCIVLGILALAWPKHTLTALAVLFGLVLIASGLFNLIFAVAASDAPTGGRVLTGVIGLLGLVIGLYALRHVDITVSALAVVLGIYWICDGVIRIFAAVDYPDVAMRTVRIVVGALAIIAGAIVLIWPHPSLLVIAVLIGVWIVMFGIFQIFLGIGIRVGAKA